MARRKKEEKVDPFERARLKKLRAAQRREERKKRKAEGGGEERTSRREVKADYTQPMVKDDYLWIRGDLTKAYAMKILNGYKDRPYWLSIPYGGTRESGPLPISIFSPCTMFRTKTRAYYGFLFREHRDLFFASCGGARKELTDTILALNPQLF